MSASLSATSHRDYVAEEALWLRSLASHRRAVDAASTSSQRGRALGNQAHVLGHLAFIAARRRDFAASRCLLAESLALKHETYDALGIGLSHLALGDVCLDEGDHEAARASHRQALDAAWNLRDAWIAAAALEGLAAAAAARDEALRALRLAGAASTLRELVDAPLSARERAELDERLAPAVLVLDPTASESAWHAGRALSIDQARAEELGGVLSQVAPSTAPALSRRGSRAALSSWYGRLIDVGGHRLYVHTRGSGVATGVADRARPTVLLSSNLGISWLAWERVAPQIAADARIVAYSRAGLRDSEPGPVPRTPGLILGDLDALLVEGRLAPPYLLVGHGFGALLHKLFAARRPGDIAGVITLGTAGRLNPADYPEPDLAEHVDLRETARQLASAPPADVPPHIPSFHLEDRDVVYQSPERVVALIQEALAVLSARE